jgi:hypothetical protein
MSRTHDVTISAFDLDRLEAALDAAHKRRDHLEQALHRLIVAAHQRFQQPDAIYDYARVELFTALELARNVLKSQISNPHEPRPSAS